MFLHSYLTLHLKRAQIHLSCVQVHCFPAWRVVPHMSWAAGICVSFPANFTNHLISQQAFESLISITDTLCLPCAMNVFKVQLDSLTTWKAHWVLLTTPITLNHLLSRDASRTPLATGKSDFRTEYQKLAEKGTLRNRSSIALKHKSVIL